MRRRDDLIGPPPPGGWSQCGSLWTLATVGALTVAAAAGRRGSRSQVRYQFSGLTCPSATPDLVQWSTDSWWYPTPNEEISWEQFRDEVKPTPQDVQASGYLGWSQDYGEPFKRWLKGQWITYPSMTGGSGRRVREVGGGTHAWYRGNLPSGMPAYVWVGSGIEHWWTPGGSGIDVEAQQQLLTALEQRLETLSQQQKITPQITLAQLRQLRGSRNLPGPYARGGSLAGRS